MTVDELEKLAPVEDVPVVNVESLTPVEEPRAENLPASAVAPETGVGAALRGFAEGGALGFSGEAAGALGAIDEAVRRAFGAGGVYAEKPLRAAMVERYLLEREAADRELSEARRARPVLTGAMEVAGGLAIPTPGASALRGAAAAGRIGETARRAAILGAGVGAISGLGRTRAETLPQAAKDVTTQAAAGALGGAAFGAVAARVAAAKTKAASDALELVKKKAEQAMRSARSALGGETSAGFRTLEQLERAVADSSVDPAVRQQALNFLTSPEGVALRNQVLESATRRGGGQVSRIEAAEQAFSEAAQKASPAEVKSATAAYLSEGLRPEVVPRVTRYLTRLAPIAIGSGVASTVGGTPGAIAGGVLGGVVGVSMGAPGTAIANMLKSPRFRYAVGDKAASALELAATRGLAALSATYYTLSNKDPEFRKAVEEAQKEQQATGANAVP